MNKRTQVLLRGFLPNSPGGLLLTVIGIPAVLVALLLTGSQLVLLFAAAFIGLWLGRSLVLMNRHLTAPLVPRLTARSFNCAVWLLVFSLVCLSFAALLLTSNTPSVGGAVLSSTVVMLLRVQRGRLAAAPFWLLLVLILLTSRYGPVDWTLLAHPLVQLVLGLAGVAVLAQVRYTIHHQPQNVVALHDATDSDTSAGNQHAWLSWWQTGSDQYGTTLAGSLKLALGIACILGVLGWWVGYAPHSSFLALLLISTPLTCLNKSLRHLSNSWLYELHPDRRALCQQVVSRNVFNMLPLFVVGLLFSRWMLDSNPDDFNRQMNELLTAQAAAPLVLLAGLYAYRLFPGEPIGDTASYMLGIVFYLPVMFCAWALESIPVARLLIATLLTSACLFTVGPWILSRADMVPLKVSREL